MRMNELVAQRFLRNHAAHKHSQDSRQQTRCRAQARAFKEISAQYPGELRRVRRLLARARVRYVQQTTLA